MDSVIYVHLKEKDRDNYFLPIVNRLYYKITESFCTYQENAVQYSFWLEENISRLVKLDDLSKEELFILLIWTTLHKIQFIRENMLLCPEDFYEELGLTAETKETLSLFCKPSASQAKTITINGKEINTEKLSAVFRLAGFCQKLTPLSPLLINLFYPSAKLILPRDLARYLIKEWSVSDDQKEILLQVKEELSGYEKKILLLYLRILNDELDSNFQDMAEYSLPSSIKYPQKLGADEKSSSLEHPYLVNRPYSQGDSEIFFGRDLDVMDLAEKVLSNTLTILTGPPGVGKTSMVKCGLFSLMKDNWCCFSFQLADVDPLMLLKNQVITLDNGAGENLFLKLNRVEENFLVVFDQFEEFLTCYPKNAKEFIKKLSEIKRDNLRFIFYVRDELLPELAYVLPLDSYFKYVYSIKPLNRKEAQKVLEDPFLPFGISYEDRLLDVILNDMAREDGFYPIELQLVGRSLHHKLENESKITFSLYNKLKKATGIINDYVPLVLDNLQVDYESGKKILASLVNSKGEKKRSSIERIEKESEFEGSVKDLSAILLKLKDINLVIQNSDHTYELINNYFAKRIFNLPGWVTDEDLKLKELQDKLNFTLKRYEEVKSYISYDDLRLLDKFYDKMYFTTDEKGIVIASAVKSGAELEHWNYKTFKEEFNTKYLLELIKDKDILVRRKTVEAIGNINDPSLVEPLKEVLKDEDPFVRIMAVVAISKVGNKNTLEPLIKAINEDRVPFVRIMATEALGLIGGSEGLDLLIKTLKDRDPFVRIKTAKILGMIGETKAVGPLITSLREDKDPFVRRQAAEALGMLGDTSAVMSLIKALNDSNPITRRSIPEALGMIGSSEAVNPLIIALEDKDPFVRRQAAEALGMIRDEQSVEPLIKALKDYDPDVRNAAAEVLGILEDIRAETALITVLKEDKVPFVRSRAAEVLGIFGGEKSAKALKEALEDDNAMVIKQVAKAIQEIKRRSILENIAK